MEMFQQLFAVAGVLGALCIVIWALKRKGWANVSVRRPRQTERRLEVIDRLALTPHHSVHLIRLADRVLLIGLSPSGCNLLETSPAAGIAPAPGIDR